MRKNDVLKVEGIMAGGFGTVAKLFMQDQRLTIEAKAIHNHLSSYAGAGSSELPNVEEICVDLKIDKKRFYEHYPLLVKAGFISPDLLDKLEGGDY